MLSSCNDGDILTVNLEFDKELSLCGDENSNNYVIYDTKTDPNESLTFLFPVSSANNLIFKPVDNPHTGDLDINNSSIKFNYRIYDGDPSGLICQEIPSSTVNITKDYTAEDGTIEYISTYEDVDGVRTVTITFNITILDLDVINTTNGVLGTYTHSFSL